MRDFTRELRTMKADDFNAVKARKNQHWIKLSEVQRLQHIDDKKRYYTNKWTALLERSETVAQKRICNNMLYHIANYTR